MYVPRNRNLINKSGFKILHLTRIGFISADSVILRLLPIKPDAINVSFSSFLLIILSPAKFFGPQQRNNYIYKTKKINYWTHSKMISSALLKATVICFAPLFFFLQVSGDFKFQCAYINYQGQSCTCGVNQLRGDDSTQLVLIVRGGAISVVPGRGQMIACQCPDKVANRTLTLAACCNSNQIGVSGLRYCVV